MFGVLNVDKPAGLTSRDAVNRIQRLLPRKTKVGHAGTLDPLATGVLVLCVGGATRLIEYVQREPKSYRGEFLLGRRSDTEDVEGDVELLPDPAHPTRFDVEQALPRFVGEIEQRPPAYSALKVQGKRAYDLARAGEQVELPARTVRIEEIALVEYEYPRLVIDVRCGGGTYVRSLGRDIAESLGSAAVMSALTRTAIGSFTLEEAARLDDLTAESLPEHLLPARRAVASLPSLTLHEEEIARLANGQFITNRFEINADEIAACDASGRLVALLKPRGEGLLQPLRNFPRR